MKKYLTLQNCVLCAAGTLILATFIMSFFVNVTAYLQGDMCSFKNAFWGCSTIGFDGKEYPISQMQIYNGTHLKMMGLLFAGLLMMVLGTIAAILVALFLKKPWAKYVVVGCAAVVLAGGIMQFFALDSFATAYVYSLKGLEEASQAEIDKAVNDMVAIFKNHGFSSPVSVVMGVFGCLSAVGLGVAPFLPEKQLLK